MTGFSRSKSEDLTKSGDATFNCAGAGIKFISSDIGTTRVIVTNTGNYKFASLRIVVQNGTAENVTLNQYSVSEVNDTNLLNPGDKRVISNSTMNIQNGSKVTVVSGECVNTYHTAIK